MQLGVYAEQNMELLELTYAAKIMKNLTFKWAKCIVLVY